MIWFILANGKAHDKSWMEFSMLTFIGDTASYIKNTGVPVQAVAQQVLPPSEKFASFFPGVKDLSGSGELKVYGKKQTKSALSFHIHSGKVGMGTSGVPFDPSFQSVNLITVRDFIGSERINPYLVLDGTIDSLNNMSGLVLEHDLFVKSAILNKIKINDRIVVDDCAIVDVHGNGTLLHDCSNLPLRLGGKSSLRFYVGRNPVFRSTDGTLKTDNAFIIYNESRKENVPDFESIFNGSKSIAVSVPSEEFVVMQGILRQNLGRISAIIKGLCEEHPFIMFFGETDASHFMQNMATNSDVFDTLGVKPNGESIAKMERLAQFTRLVNTKPSVKPPIIDLS